MQRPFAHVGRSGFEQSDEVSHSFATHTLLPLHAWPTMHGRRPSTPSAEHCSSVTQQYWGFGAEHPRIANTIRNEVIQFMKSVIGPTSPRLLTNPYLLEIV